MPFLSSSKCVLFLSDEGVHAYDVLPGGVRALEFISWDVQNVEQSVVSAIRRKSASKSIIILNDMVEQHYRKERVPNVGFLDRANVIKRRVAVAFPSYPIRAGMKLKEKAPQDAGAGGALYLFAAVPLSDNIKQTLSAVGKSYKSVAGFCLLPVESASLVHALSKKLTRTAEKTAKWAVFIGQHPGGGLRQIVTRNGELALTRLTAITENHLDYETWTSELVAELKGTMGYLSRFGFDPNEGLDVIVVADSAAAERLETKIDLNCNLNVMNAAEVANLLGLKIGRQDDLRYADAIHVAWAAKKGAFTLPLQVAQLERVSGPRQVAAVASIVMLAGISYFAYESYNKYSQWMKNADDLTSARAELATVQAERTAEIEKKKAAGLDFLIVENSTREYRALEENAMRPLPVLEKIGRALGPDLSIVSLDVSSVPAGPTPPQEYDPATGEPLPLPPVRKLHDIVIKIILPAELEPEKGVQQISDLVLRLQENLPDHTVDVLKQVADLSYTGNFVGESATGQQEQEKKDYEAEIRVRGELR